MPAQLTHSPTELTSLKNGRATAANSQLTRATYRTSRVLAPMQESSMILEVISGGMVSREGRPAAKGGAPAVCEEISSVQWGPGSWKLETKELTVEKTCALILL